MSDGYEACIVEDAAPLKPVISYRGIAGPNGVERGSLRIASGVPRATAVQAVNLQPEWLSERWVGMADDSDAELLRVALLKISILLDAGSVITLTDPDEIFEELTLRYPDAIGAQAVASGERRRHYAVGAEILEDGSSSWYFDTPGDGVPPASLENAPENETSDRSAYDTFMQNVMRIDIRRRRGL